MNLGEATRPALREFGDQEIALLNHHLNMGTGIGNNSLVFIDTEIMFATFFKYWEIHS